MIFQVFGVEVSTKNPLKNQSKIEAQDGLPLGIDFWWILVGFGNQFGVENRATSDQKSIKKTNRKNNEKKMRFGNPWVGGFAGRDKAPQGS